MKPKTFFILATVMSAMVLGGIHLGLRGEVSKKESTVDMSYLFYQQARNECGLDPLECARAEELGSRFDRDLDNLQEARRQASLFLTLALVVPGALIALGLLARRLSRARSRQTAESGQA